MTELLLDGLTSSPLNSPSKSMPNPSSVEDPVNQPDPPSPSPSLSVEDRSVSPRSPLLSVEYPPLNPSERELSFSVSMRPHSTPHFKDISNIGNKVSLFFTIIVIITILFEHYPGK